MYWDFIIKKKKKKSFFFIVIFQTDTGSRCSSHRRKKKILHSPTENETYPPSCLFLPNRLSRDLLNFISTIVPWGTNAFGSQNDAHIPTPRISPDNKRRNLLDAMIGSITRYTAPSSCEGAEVDAMTMSPT